MFLCLIIFPGPDEILKVIKKERVLMGFVFGSGKLKDGVVYAISSVGGILRMIFKKDTPFGEIDGNITPRLNRLVSILRQGDLCAKTSINITDFLTTHASIVVLLSIYLIKNDIEINNRKDLNQVAESKDYFRISLLALREFIDLFRILGRKIVPSTMTLVKTIPLFIMIAGVRSLIKSKLGEIIFWDYSNGKDEISYLAKELEELVEKVDLPLPNIRKVLGMNK